MYLQLFAVICSSIVTSPRPSQPLTVVVVIKTGELSQKEFVDKYSSPLSSALGQEGIGKITNAYEQSAETETGFISQEAHIWVQLNDKSNIQKFVEILRTLGVSRNTELRYIIDNRAHRIRINVRP